MYDNIYKGKHLKYPLTDKEYTLIPKVWKFLKIFTKPFVFISDYRNYVIRKVNKKYSVEEFFELESVLNKMFWNLRWLLFPLWHNQYMSKSEYEEFVGDSKYGGFKELPDYLLLCKFQSYKDDLDLDYKIKNNLQNSTYYRSFINKLVIVDKKEKVIMTKLMEGSADIFNKNYFNLLSSQILFDKDLYETVMKNPHIIKNKNIELSKFYYQFDYGFPNMNYCCFEVGDADDRLERIKKMYFWGDSKYWFRIIK